MKYIIRITAFFAIYLPLFLALKQMGFGSALTPIAVGIAFYGSKPVTNYFMRSYMKEEGDNSGRESNQESNV